MSPAAKAVLVIGVLILAGLLAYGAYYYIQRRNAQEDYNFNLPHQLVGMSLDNVIRRQYEHL